MLFKYYMTKCTFTLEELMEFFKETEYEGTLEEWVEEEMEVGGLTALEEVHTDDCLSNLRDEAIYIRGKFFEKVYERLDEVINDLFYEFQTKLKITSGDITPLELDVLENLQDNLANLITDVLIEEKGDEFAVKMEGGLE